MQRLNLVKKLKTLSRVEHKLSPRSSSYPHLYIPKRAADIPRALHQNCSAEANRILPLSSTMAKEEPKHQKRCTYFHCFQTPWLQLHHPVPQPVLGDPLDTNARWEQPGLLASISSQVLYHPGKVRMHSIYLLIAKSGFCHSLSWDSCACTDLKKVTLQNCIYANCLFSKVYRNRHLNIIVIHKLNNSL